MKLLINFMLSLVLCLVFLLPASAQQLRIITGTVTGPENTPLANASVVLKGNKQGVKTNLLGAFSITVPAGAQTLVVSFVGMQTKEFLIATDATSAVLSVKESDGLLDEVVVVSTGYQTVPKERATGNFGTVSKEQLGKPSTNISSRIVGQVAGVQALRMDEEGNPFFQIRGLSTLYANQEPLVVVDGFPIQGSYNSINPNDVESVTILKDAAAASIWGSRAVNGVIVVTSKNAKKGTPLKIEFSAFTRIGGKIDLSYSNPLATSAQQVEYEKLSFDKWGATPNNGLPTNFGYAMTPGQTALNEAKLGFITPARRDFMLDSLKSLNNSQQISDLLLANPVTKQYNLSLFSSTERMSNAVSFMFEQNQSNFKKTYNERFLLNYRNTVNIKKWLDFNLNTMVQYNKFTNNGATLGDIQRLAPYEMLQNPDGSYRGTSERNYNPLLGRVIPTHLFPYNDWSYNIARETESRSNVTREYNARVQAGIIVKPMKGLSIESSIQYEHFNSQLRNLDDTNSYTARITVNQAAFWNPGLPAAFTTAPIPNLPKGAILNQNRSQAVAWNFRNLVRFNKTFGSKHEVNFLAGTEQQSRVVQTFSQPTTYGYNDATLQLGTFPNGPGGNPVNGNQNGTLPPTNLTIRNWLNQTTTFSYVNSFGYTTDRFFSAFGNVAYTYDDKYTLSGSARADGANFVTDDPKLRYNPFWSVGASWQLWKEKFFNVSFVDRLTIKATYGYNGNQDRSTSFKPLISLGATPNVLTNQFTAFFSSLGNPTLRWEKTATTNFGIDYSLFKGKLFGSINYYHRKGKDLLAFVAIPAVNGSTSQFLNNAAMVNKGIELEIGTAMKITNDIQWRANLNFSYNKNKITDLFITQYNSFSLVGRSTASYAVDYNANTLWMYKYMGFNTATPFPQPTVLGPGGVNYDMQSFIPGDARTYLDNIGTLVAPYTLGFSSSFDYKGFNLSLIVTGNFGHVFQRRGFNYPVQFGGRVLPNKFVGDILDAAQNDKSNEVLTLPTNPNEPRFFFWDRFYNNLSYLGESASWIRMQEVNLTYNLPRQLLTKAGINNLRVYVQGNDLFVILSNKYGEDPLYALGTLNPRPKTTIGVKFDF
ncbi:MAG: SusC/RagA family TonB-linked outer membrane protein [Bacteroidota bacterium]|jgi:TonB-linked SusC/RagA family outer membrane protein